MDRRAAIVLGMIVILVVAIVIGTIFYLTKVFRNNSSRVITSNPGSMTIPRGSSLPATGSSLGAQVKTYQGQGFSMQYPANWGVLSCSNSKNFEFNPDGGDKRVVCDMSQLPITVLVGVSCTGASQVTLGRNIVLKSKIVAPDGYTKYEWCVKGFNTTLDFTDRVSQNGERATDKEDYSQDVEKIISQTSFGGAS